MNILFTSIGRRVELIQAFKNAYRSLNLTGKVIGVDIDPLAPALQIVTKAYIVPRVDSPHYIPCLINICKQEQVQLIFPLIDPDVPILSRFRKEIEAVGAKLAVVDSQAAAVVGDKWLTYGFFQRLGVPTPQSWLPEQIDLAAVNYPLIVKPRKGSAAKNTFLVNNTRELEFFIEYVPEPIIQEYLPGPEITNDVVCTLDGEVLGVASRQRIEVRWGEVAKGKTVYVPAITTRCMRIVEALPAVGPITVQCMKKNGEYYFTEINARMGGGLPLAIAAGLDAPRRLLARAADLSLDVPAVGVYETSVFLTRYDSSLFLRGSDLDKISGYHI